MRQRERKIEVIEIKGMNEEGKEKGKWVLVDKIMS